MLRKWVALAVLAILGVDLPGATAHDESKYPNMRGQWVRTGSAQFDPTKPAGFAQQAPLTPEYRKIFMPISSRTARPAASPTTPPPICLPGGMPRTMIVYETLETLITGPVTYIRGSYMNELRRIYTDGRDWPEKITPAFVGYSIGKWIDEDGDGKLRRAGSRDPRPQGAAHL